MDWLCYRGLRHDVVTTLWLCQIKSKEHISRVLLWLLLVRKPARKSTVETDVYSGVKYSEIWSGHRGPVEINTFETVLKSNFLWVGGEKRRNLDTGGSFLTLWIEMIGQCRILFTSMEIWLERTGLRVCVCVLCSECESVSLGRWYRQTGWAQSSWQRG